MKKKIILFIPLLMICAALAAPPTGLPHAFYGTTTFNSADTPVDAVITATCDSSTSTITVTTAGEYGGAGGDEEKLIVQGCSNGDTITFSISVTGYTGTSNVTDTYVAGAVEEKTLAFTGTAIGGGGGGGSGGSSGGASGGAAATTTTTTAQPGATTTIPGRQTTSTTTTTTPIISPVTSWFKTPLGILLIVITIIIIIILIFKFIL